MRHVNRLYLEGLSQRQNLDSVNLLLRFLKRTILVFTGSFVSVPFMLYFRTLTLVMTFSHTNKAQVLPLGSFDVTSRQSISLFVRRIRCWNFSLLSMLGALRSGIFYYSFTFWANYVSIGLS
ncbi:hypothetical protein O6H91_Y060500 [Diphasiastrum complanatum]|nr:hypothetical protein O6H91_Y060500 [Diphasiastrum complanatum]